MAHVEIVDVVRAELSADQFWGGCLDLPIEGERRDHYAIVLAGWVLHRDVDSLEVRAVSRGLVIGRWPVNLARADVTDAFTELPATPACGFMGVIRTLDLPGEFELCIEIDNGRERWLLATIRGRRSPLVAQGQEERLRPVLLTTLGRTGSTLLMQLLGQHPRIVVHPPFPYETRVAAYWSAVFAQLASPASYLQAAAAADARRFWWVGYSAFPVETYVDQDPAVRMLGGTALEAMASFVRRQVSSFYEASAALQGKAGSGAAWFAEKQLPQPERQQLQLALFPDGRAIYLVRDFRDMVASILAFDDKRGQRGFGRDAESDSDRYMAKLGVAVDELMAAFRGAGRHGLLVRYEDLVREPGPVLARILGFLELEHSDALVDAMVRAAAETDREAIESHRTTTDARASIGRYRRDLSPDLVERCEAHFRDGLAACGYALSAVAS